MPIYFLVICNRWSRADNASPPQPMFLRIGEFVFLANSPVNMNLDAEGFVEGFVEVITGRRLIGFGVQVIGPNAGDVISEGVFLEDCEDDPRTCACSFGFLVKLCASAEHAIFYHSRATMAAFENSTWCDHAVIKLWVGGL